MSESSPCTCAQNPETLCNTDYRALCAVGIPLLEVRIVGTDGVTGCTELIDRHGLIGREAKINIQFALLRNLRTANGETLRQSIAEITLRNLTHEGNVHCCVTAVQDEETFTRSNRGIAIIPLFKVSVVGVDGEAGIAETINGQCARIGTENVRNFVSAVVKGIGND